MENNKLIAEFMGGIISSVPNLINLPQTIGQSSILCVKGSEGLPSGTYKVERINELQYHSSWDWLMPVVEKIENLGYEFTIVENRCKVINNTDHSIKELFHIETIGSKIETTYDAVIEFINQYGIYTNVNKNN